MSQEVSMFQLRTFVAGTVDSPLPGPANPRTLPELTRQFSTAVEQSASAPNRG